MTKLDELMNEDVTFTSRLPEMEEALKKLKADKKTTEEEYMSAVILLLQQKDYEEYVQGVKNKSYALSKFIKTEMVVRSARQGCTKASFKLNIQATKALLGLAFLIEDGSIAFSLKPIDRKTYQVSFKLYSENMPNSQIYMYNAEYKELNIPLNADKEVIPEEEQYTDNGFTTTNFLKFIKS